MTGGASGLGEATVRFLHSMGASIAIADMNTSRMVMLEKELNYTRIIVCKCDVTNENDVMEAIEFTVSHYGSLHVAIPCAGIQ